MSAARSTNKTVRHVALVRGINVGGKRKLPMSDLRAMFEAAGCIDVASYIQSGNVVFSVTPRALRRTHSAVADAIATRFGEDVPVTLRSAAELAGIVRSSPFSDTDSVHVAFLAETPDPERLRALDPNRSPGDSIHPHGREIYLHLPRGVSESKFTTSYLDSKLAQKSTVRNWRTVLQLANMVGV